MSIITTMNTGKNAAAAAMIMTITTIITMQTKCLPAGAMRLPEPTAVKNWSRSSGL